MRYWHATLCGIDCPFLTGPIVARSSIAMQIRVLLFGVLKDMVGQPTERVDVPEGARVGDLLAQYSSRFPQFAAFATSLAVSVNQEYSSMNRVLADGDELGLLPPVSGGLPESVSVPDQILDDEILIVSEPIIPLSAFERTKRPRDGAAVVFEGVVRDNTRGRRTLYLDYEAYEPMALKQMQALASQARKQFAVDGISIIHRVGRLQIGETSVQIVVASAHRAAAFDACRWIIDTLKKTVPIWKKEYFEDGSVWADGEPFPPEIQRPEGIKP